jgi:uncharacterized protein (TIGR02145 family)
MKIKIKNFLGKGAKLLQRSLAPLKNSRKIWKAFAGWCWATLPRRIVSSILIVLFVITPIFNILFVPKTQAAWWNDQWLYRKSIAVTNNTTAQTNVYISLTVDTSDTTRFQPDCGDVRFTDTTGNLQDYFIVSGCGTASTSVHVNLQTFPSGLQNIFYYYGNPTAPNGFSSTDFSTQATNYTVGSLGSEEKSTAPVAFWKFDEGFGITAQDSTAQNNDGTLTNMSATSSPTSGWQTEDQCVAGKCLAFDGTDDSVNVGTMLSLANITIEAWVYRTSSTVNQGIVRKNFAYAISLFNDTIQVAPGNNWAFYNTGQTIPLNTWTHLVWSYNGSTMILYKNGARVWSTALVGAFPNNANPTRIGFDDNNWYWGGKIDEPKIYPYVRTKAQILQDYNAGLAGISANKGTATSFGDNSDKWLSDGLVGYWKMDEASWNGTTGEVKDASGNNNHGTAAGGATTGAGKFGSGGSFDGSNGYTTFDNTAFDAVFSGTKSWTVSYWVNYDNAEYSPIFNKAKSVTGGFVGVEIQTSSGRFRVADVGGHEYNPVYIAYGSNLAGTGWRNVAVKYDGKSFSFFVDGTLKSSFDWTYGVGDPSGSPFMLGKNHWGNLMDGSIDETRIYNRALSPAEVRKLYDWAPGPVAHWKLDEKNGTSANDSSGNGNNGTLTNGPKWVPGKIGGATKLDGVNDYINIPQGISANLNFSTYKAFTISGWVQNNNGTGTQSILGTGKPYSLNGKGFILTYGYPSAGLIGAQIGTGNSGTSGNFGSSATLVANAWTHLSFVFTSTAINLYKNGSFVGSVSISGQGLAPLGDAAVSIGTYAQANLGFWLGRIDDVRIYNYARTPEQIMQDMGGDVASSDYQSFKEATAYYKFDEGAGTTANNLGTGGATLNGTLTNMAAPATATSGWTDNGKFGKGLGFDGVDDRVAISNFQFPISNQFSISQWLNVQTLATNKAILGKWGSSQNNFLLKTDDANSNQLKICLASSLTDNCTNYAVTTDANLATATWQNVQITYDGSQASNALKLKLFLNGVQKTLTFSGTIPATLATSTATLELGGNANLATFFSGKIDEVKIFPYALSADDVRTEYNRGNAVNMASSGPLTAGGSSTSARAEYCPPGNTEGNCAVGQNPSPVAQWQMDEGTGTTVKDTSGNNNNGTLSGSPAWTNGKTGNAVNINGNSKLISLTTSVGKVGYMTASLWYKRDDGNSANGYRTILGHATANIHQLIVLSSSKNIGIWDGTWRDFGYNVPDDGKWHNYQVIYNSGVNAALYVDGVYKNQIATTLDLSVNPIGKIGNWNSGNYWAGPIDNVKIYPYARTPAQIAYDYNRGGPVGWWKLDECQSTTINDASGNGNNGTLTVGATGTQTAIGTCTTASTAWGNGASGKFSSAMSFDGSDDKVAISNFQFPISNQFSISQWLNVQTLATNKAILGKWGSSQNNFLLKTDDANSNQLKICLASNLTDNCTNYAVTTDANLATATWQNVQITYDGSQASNALKLKLFLNGVQKTLTFTGTLPATLTTSTAALEIGGSSSLATYFSGKIDDVRIYNYALSEEQVYSVVNGGASLSFGSNGPCGDVTSVADADGNAYGVVKVGAQCWMDKNLNVGTMLASVATLPTNNSTIEKWCYNNDTSICAIEGGLYHWDEAMGYSTTEGAQGICPAGWHIPTDAQQYILENYLRTGATCVATRSGRDCNPAGTKLKDGATSGLNILLTGYRYFNGSVFTNRPTNAVLWSSSQSGSTAWNRSLYSSFSTVGRYTYSKAFGFSVRCLKN